MPGQAHRITIAIPEDASLCATEVLGEGISNPQTPHLVEKSRKVHVMHWDLFWQARN
jgi:hypothetical protein